LQEEWAVASYAVFTFSATMPIVHHPAAGVIGWKESANRRPLTVKVVAHKDLGGECQLFPLKHLLYTVV
jgi:hypothetical protein